MTGRTVIVTGGGTGIGLATARAFAAAGDTVVVTGRRSEPLALAVKELGGDTRAVQFDAADPTAVTAALAELPEQVDVLVNNAGGNPDIGRPGPARGDLNAVAEAWHRNFESNVVSAVLVTTALTPRFRDNARIVTVGSIAARTGSGSGSYGAAKAAVEAWTIDVATALGPRGITANVVSPGLIVDTEFFKGGLSDERLARLVSATKTGRAGTPDDVAATIAFLASAEAGHLTGQVLHVNGGAYLGR